MNKREQKEQIIDFISKADEGDLQVLSALVMAQIAQAHEGGKIRFKVYFPLITYECSLIELPPSSKIRQIMVSEVENCKISESDVKALYEEFLKEKEARNERGNF